MADGIVITGLREFKAGLRRMDSALPRRVRQAANRAAQIVVDAARPRVPTGPARRGHARDSIRVASTASAVRVRGGGARFPYYGWLEFGGRVGRNRSVRRERVSSGRYIRPAYVENADRVRDEMAEGLRDLADSAGVRARVR